MKKVLTGLIFVLGVLVFVGFSPNSTQAATNEEIVMPKYYDANNQEIKPYTEEEYLEKAEQAVEESIVEKKDDTLSTYSVSRPNYYATYGDATYSNYVWVNGGKTYRNPIYINFEIENRTTGKAIYFYNSAGTFQGKVVFPKYGNIWYVANVDYLVRGISYKFKLVSESGELSKIKHGNIAYDG